MWEAVPPGDSLPIWESEKLNRIGGLVAGTEEKGKRMLGLG